jgi:hypothetical protein
MTHLEILSRVGDDGVLKLDIPLGIRDANRPVKVTVDAVDQQPPATEMTQEQWAKFLRDTAGSIDDPTFVRPAQGTLEQGEELFP